jgi:hypothetical protein
MAHIDAPDPRCRTMSEVCEGGLLRKEETVRRMYASKRRVRQYQSQYLDLEVSKKEV